MKAAVLALALAAAPACAQDFAPAAPAGPQPGPLALLDRALPAGTRAIDAEAACTRWWGLAELTTRAAAASLAIRSARLALGISQTGTPELGWTALGLAAGSASREAGAALHACARADRDASWSPAHATGPSSGAEAGAGAWLAPAHGLLVWASAPQLWTRGVAPPFVRPLELGLRAERGDCALWCSLRAPRSGDEGERGAGAQLTFGSLALWGEARDRPLRGAAGVTARRRSLALSVRVDEHPVLGETVRAGISIARSRAEAP